MSQSARQAQDADYRPAISKGVRRLVAKATVGLDGPKLDRLMAELFQFAEQTFAALAAKDPPRRTIACGEGCAHCCHFYVQVTPIEAVGIARALRKNLPPDALTGLRQRVAQSYARVRGKDAAGRMVLAEPCPLLDGGRCSIYADRPFVCRGANSADASACRSGLGNPESVPVPMYVHQRQVYGAVGRGAADGLRDAGVRPHLLELVSALKIALEHEDPVAAWRNGTLDFSAAACVEAAKKARP